ncbi:hypothetical protein NDU88_001691 [Pleurodeles waltl]|uniref:Uncharacterized protein n=1 Tax=Pleurodeles waltl TaxID=8319 RepID=A0AAV7T0F3_PLEWA|nr:hypothetical protein NDU88_001691 [Pleurodeles waltl]
MHEPTRIPVGPLRLALDGEPDHPTLYHHRKDSRSHQEKPEEIYSRGIRHLQQLYVRLQAVHLLQYSPAGGEKEAFPAIIPSKSTPPVVTYLGVGPAAR